MRSLRVCTPTRYYDEQIKEEMSCIYNTLVVEEKYIQGFCGKANGRYGLEGLWVELGILCTYLQCRKHSNDCGCLRFGGGAVGVLRFGVLHRVTE